jgi:hypothetical protein
VILCQVDLPEHESRDAAEGRMLRDMPEDEAGALGNATQFRSRELTGTHVHADITIHRYAHRVACLLCRQPRFCILHAHACCVHQDVWMVSMIDLNEYELIVGLYSVSTAFMLQRNVMIQVKAQYCGKTSTSIDTVAREALA